MIAFRLILIFFTLALILIIFSINFSLSYYYDSGVSKKPSLILINKGLTLSEIANLLNKEEVLEYPELFSYILRFKKLDKTIRAGEYLFPEGITTQTVFKILSQGKTYMRSITIIEGQTIDKIIDKIDMTSGLKGNIINFPKEGEIFPNTYYFSWGETKQKILDLMKSSMKEAINNAWENRSPEVYISNIRDAVILASIIEKETSLTDEKPIVSSVFHNRLKIGMRLQSDPTVIYGINKKKIDKINNLKAKDIKVFTKYNTYMINGLPPGPISNPGLDSIYAALNPKKTNYLYFVANGKGGHYFSSSYSEHLKNIKRWRRYKSDKK